MVIRGCLDHLTGLQYSGNIVNGCEFGVVESPTVDGRSKLYLKHQLVTCSFEMCNTFDTTLPNSKCPEDFRESKHEPFNQTNFKA